MADVKTFDELLAPSQRSLQFDMGIVKQNVLNQQFVNGKMLLNSLKGVLKGCRGSRVRSMTGAAETPEAEEGDEQRLDDGPRKVVLICAAVTYALEADCLYRGTGQSLCLENLLDMLSSALEEQEVSSRSEVASAVIATLFRFLAKAIGSNNEGVPVAVNFGERDASGAGFQLPFNVTAKLNKVFTKVYACLDKNESSTVVGAFCSGVELFLCNQSAFHARLTYPNLKQSTVATLTERITNYTRHNDAEV